MKPSFDDGWAKLYTGTALDVLREMPDQSVHMAVTSPPYWGLRSYLDSEHPAKGQELGTEKTPDEFVAKLVEVFAEVWRVLRDDGQLWVNIGDSYASSPPGNTTVGVSAKSTLHVYGPSDNYRKTLAAGHATKRDTARSSGLKPKDLAMVPARLAIALQSWGWYLRQELVWAKDSCMPESVRDRCTRAHEFVYMLTKKPRYFYDAEAIKEPGADWGPRDRTTSNHNMASFVASGQTPHNGLTNGDASGGRNARSVWRINPKPYPGSHFAVFPPELPMRCIKAGTSERGVCSKCGAPWQRIIEKSGETTTDRARENGYAEHANAYSGPQKQNLDFKGSHWKLPARTSETVGWEPTCSCNGTFVEEPYEVIVKNRETGEDETHTRYRPVYTPAVPLKDHPIIPATVLDPFAGSGTTLYAARKLGRRSIGIDLDARSSGLLEERMGYQGVLL